MILLSILGILRALREEPQLFITFEGMDGCGKSTQVSRFVATLEERGVPLVVTREPGGTKIGEAIREILLQVENSHMVPLAELLLYEADRAQHTSGVIKTAREAGNWVICDRYYDATTVYQGIVQGQDGQLIEQLNREATLGCRPDITFLLDCPAEVGMERIAKRDGGNKGKDRFERKALDFHTKIRYGYLRLASEHEHRFRIIDCTLPVDRVARKIQEIIAPYVAKRG